jgi:hypothetical protein
VCVLADLLYERLADLLYERRELGVFGLGSARTIDDYAKQFGIDYRARTVERDFQRVYADWLPPRNNCVRP